MKDIYIYILSLRRPFYLPPFFFFITARTASDVAFKERRTRTANQLPTAKLHSLCQGKLEHAEPPKSHSRTMTSPFSQVLTRNPGFELKAATSELGSSKLRL